MSDLISRQAAIEAMSDTWKHICYVARRKHPTKGEEAVYMDMCGTINRVPSAQPERKKGKWIPQFDKWGDYVTTTEGYKCSECGVFDSMKDNFCPNCGAEMEPSFGNKSEK